MPFVNIRIYEGWAGASGQIAKRVTARSPTSPRCPRKPLVCSRRSTRPTVLGEAGERMVRMTGASPVTVRDAASPVVGARSSSSRIATLPVQRGAVWHPRALPASGATCPATTSGAGPPRTASPRPQAVQQVQRAHVGRQAGCCLRARLEQVSRTEPDGRITPVATHYAGKQLTVPTIIVCAAAGGVYFTTRVRPCRVLGRRAAAGAVVPGRVPGRPGSESPSWWPTTLTGPNGLASRSRPRLRHDTAASTSGSST